jgi:hypothetical protein
VFHSTHSVEIGRTRDSKVLSLSLSFSNFTASALTRWKGVLVLREALPFWIVGAVTIFTVAVTMAPPSSFVRRFFAICTLGSGVTDRAGVASSSSSDSEELDEELDELREMGLTAAVRFLDDFASSELELSDESLSESESEVELESELEEVGAALGGFNPVFFGGPLATSESESELELELELESELEDVAFCVGLFAFGGLTSSSESESESESELVSEVDVEDVFGFKVFFLVLPSRAREPESRPLSALASDSSSSLESELDSSEDSSSLSSSSAEDKVLLESRFVSATSCPAFGRASSLSSLLSSGSG